jgi:hypothetical protein
MAICPVSLVYFTTSGGFPAIEKKVVPFLFKTGYFGVFLCEKSSYEKNRNTPLLLRGQKSKKPHFPTSNRVF